MNNKKKVGIFITGDEVLFGKTLDKNTPYFAHQCNDLGLDIEYSIVCGDDKQKIEDVLRYLLERVDIILMTGGLGPTADDLTAEVIGKLTGQPLEFNQAAWQNCLDRFKVLKRKEIPESNKKQAMLPKGCILLPNPLGTAAGFSVQAFFKTKKIDIFCMPGVPFEMHAMFEKYVSPLIAEKHFFRAEKIWQIFAVGESKIQHLLQSVEDKCTQLFPRAKISYRARGLYVTYKVTIDADDEEQKKSAQFFLDEDYQKSVDENIKENMLYHSDLALENVVCEKFSARKIVIGFAESCTGGLLSATLCSVPGASKCFISSTVTYANESKVLLLGVESKAIADHGAVSHAVAQQMARGLRERMGIDLGVSITGIAGPGGGTPQKPVGLVHFGLCIGAYRVSDVQKLIHHMKHFGWEVAADKKSEHVEFVCGREFGTLQNRDVIQMLACQFVMGSMIALCDAL